MVGPRKCGAGVPVAVAVAAVAIETAAAAAAAAVVVVVAIAMGVVVVFVLVVALAVVGHNTPQQPLLGRPSNCINFVSKGVIALSIISCEGQGNSLGIKCPAAAPVLPWKPSPAFTCRLVEEPTNY